jgi:hypothetical protein
VRRVTALDVPCGACGAVVGRRCRRLSMGGGTLCDPHEVRRRRATEEQLRLNPEHVVGQLDLFPAKDARS